MDREHEDAVRNHIIENHGIESGVLVMGWDALDTIRGCNFPEKMQFDDKSIWTIFRSGILKDVPMFSSSGMSELLMHFQPNDIEDLSVLYALYRGGNSEQLEMYTERFDRRNDAELYDIMEILPGWADDSLYGTYCLPIFQEQTMNIVEMHAGFTYEEADRLRRALASSQEPALVSLKEKFLQGAGIHTESNIDEYEKVWNHFLKYGSGQQSFNESHAVARAILAYKVVWMQLYGSN